MSSQKNTFKIITENRKASFHYTILETLEAGIILKGSEVKSIRENRCSLNEAFIGEMSQSSDAENLFLFNANIPIYKQAKSFNHAPKEPRKLLLHKRELHKLIGAVRKKGKTIIPLSMFFNEKGLIKLKIALAEGKNIVDKRETIKEHDWNIHKARILKTHNR